MAEIPLSVGFMYWFSKGIQILFAVVAILCFLFSIIGFIASDIPFADPYTVHAATLFGPIFGVLAIVSSFLAREVASELHRQEHSAFYKALAVLPLVAFIEPLGFIGFVLFPYGPGTFDMPLSFYSATFASSIVYVKQSIFVAVALSPFIAILLYCRKYLSVVSTKNHLIFWGAWVVLFLSGSYLIWGYMASPLLFPGRELEAAGLTSCRDASDCASVNPGLFDPYPAERICTPLKGTFYESYAGNFCKFKRIYFFGPKVNGFSISASARGRGDKTGSPVVSQPNILWWDFAIKRDSAAGSSPSTAAITIIYPDGSSNTQPFPAAFFDRMLQQDTPETLADGEILQQSENIILSNILGADVPALRFKDSEAVAMVNGWFPSPGKYQVVWSFGNASSSPFEIEIRPQ